MDRLRGRKKRKSLVETDDEHDPVVEIDHDWVPDEDETEQIQASENDNDKSLPEDIEFDSTDGFKLKIVKAMKQSNHLIWNMFGQLLKNDKPVDRVKDRIYCNKCFEKKKFKR